MFTFVIILHVVVSIFLIFVILLQPGKGDAMAALAGGGGSSQTVFGGRGSVTFLSKVTTVCAIIFAQRLGAARAPQSRRTGRDQEDGDDEAAAPDGADRARARHRRRGGAGAGIGNADRKQHAGHSGARGHQGSGSADARQEVVLNQPRGGARSRALRLAQVVELADTPA